MCLFYFERMEWSPEEGNKWVIKEADAPPQERQTWLESSPAERHAEPSEWLTDADHVSFWPLTLAEKPQIKTEKVTNETVYRQEMSV